MYDIFLVISLAVFLLIILAGFRYLQKNVSGAGKAGVFIAAAYAAALFLVFPQHMEESDNEIFKAILLSGEHAFRVFNLDAGYEELRECVLAGGCRLKNIYLTWAAILQLLAPVLLISVLLSLFRSIADNAHLAVGYFRNMYVFSELNDRSLALAASCREKEGKTRRKPLILFMNISGEEGEQNALMEKAKALRAVCMHKDISALNLRAHSGKAAIRLFAAGNSESGNVSCTLELMEKYGACEQVSLYSFVDSEAGAALIGSAMSADLKMTVHRINTAQALVYTYLYRNSLLTRVAADGQGGKKLKLVLVGMGDCGIEFLKGFVWSFQLPGIVPEIHVFPEDEAEINCFAARCPELMKMNHSRISGEAQYDICFHEEAFSSDGGTESLQFDEAFIRLGRISAAFVCQGSDEKNVETALKLRRLLAKTVPDDKPLLEVLVRDPLKAATVRKYSLDNFKGTDYGLHLIGDTESLYSCDVIMNSELEEKARERHLAWTDRSDDEELRRQTKNFYRYEYFSRSSMASVIRKKIRMDMGVPGTDKPVSERTKEEKQLIRIAEHAGWNAYMRTEGYSVGPRDDMARLHPDLIPFEQLSAADQEKDDD